MGFEIIVSYTQESDDYVLDGSKRYSLFTIGHFVDCVPK